MFLLDTFRDSKVVQALRLHEPKAYLDVHLCVTQPAQYLEELAKAGKVHFNFDDFEFESKGCFQAKRV